MNNTCMNFARMNYIKETQTNHTTHTHAHTHTQTRTSSENPDTSYVL